MNLHKLILTNNACYKEVWVTTAGKWLSLLSEFQE